MTDSAGDSSSIKTLDVDTGSEVADSVKEKLGSQDVVERTKEKLDGTKRYYALYSLQPQR